MFGNGVAEVGKCLHGLRRRRVVNHALTEGNGAWVVADESGDVRNHRALYRLHAFGVDHGLFVGFSIYGRSSMATPPSVR